MTGMFAARAAGGAGRYYLNDFLILALTLSVLGLAGCFPSHQIGPVRPITVDDDVALMSIYTNPNLSSFETLPKGEQAAFRNKMITARMYVADLEYHNYEAALTKEIQTEGLAATATSLGLTTTASLIPVAQTSRLLSGIASGVTGLDKAYNEKELISNTIQALQV